MVVGKGRTLLEPATVAARATTLRVAGRRCAVGAATPLAVLAAADRAGGPSFALRDYGSCSRAARDAGGLFVTRVGPDRNRGRDGWVYKVGRRAGTTPAADPSGPFGTGRRIAAGARVVWFWCVLRTGGCQRTLSRARAAQRGRRRAADRDGHRPRRRGARPARRGRDGRPRRPHGHDGRRRHGGADGPRAPPVATRSRRRPRGLVPAFAEQVTVS